MAGKLLIACTLVLLLLRYRASCQSRNVAQLIADLQRHLRPRCVFLPYEPRAHPPVYEERLAAETTKLLPSYASLYYGSTEGMSEEKKFQLCMNTSPLQVLVSRNNTNFAIMEKVMALYLWRSSVWLLVLGGGGGAGTTEDLLRPTCKLRTHVVLAAQLSPQGVRLSRVSCPRGHLVRESLGLWTGPGGLNLPPGYEAAATNPLSGSTLRVAVLEVPRITQLYAKNKRVGGIFGNIWEAFARGQNFTSELVLVPGSEYGSQEPNGSWNGVVGMVMRREVDVGLAPLTMTKSRADVVEFTVPLLMSNYMIFIRKPSAMSINWKSFMKPFSWELWVTVAVLVVVVGAANTAAYAIMRRHAGPREEQYVPPADNLFYAFTILYCYQGLDKLPNAMSCRIVYILTFLTAVVLSEAYSGKLISFIAVKKTYLPFTSLRGLYEDGTYKFGVGVSTAEADLFKNSKQPFMRDVHQKLMAPDADNYVADELQGLQRACDIDYAFLTSYEETISFVPQVSCAVVTLPEIFFKSALAIALPKGSPYINIINARITAAMASGVVSRLYRRAWPHEDELPSVETEPVEFSNIVPLLNILVAGVVASLVLLTVELAFRPSRGCFSSELVLPSSQHPLREMCCNSRAMSVLRGVCDSRRHSF